MRKLKLTGLVGTALLGFAMSAGLAQAAGNPCSPMTYGAIGDGTVGTNNGTDNTVAIQTAINNCAARRRHRLAQRRAERQERLPDRPDQLASHVLLQINAGVTLLATTDQGRYQYRLPRLPDAGDRNLSVPPDSALRGAGLRLPGGRYRNHRDRHHQRPRQRRVHVDEPPRRYRTTHPISGRLSARLRHFTAGGRCRRRGAASPSTGRRGTGRRKPTSRRPTARRVRGWWNSMSATTSR